MENLSSVFPLVMVYEIESSASESVAPTGVPTLTGEEEPSRFSGRLNT